MVQSNSQGTLKRDQWRRQESIVVRWPSLSSGLNPLGFEQETGERRRRGDKGRSKSRVEFGLFFFPQKMRPLGPLSLQTGSQSLPEIWFSCLSNGIKPNIEAHAYYPSIKEVEPGGSGVLDSHSHKVWWFLAVTSATSSPGQLAHLWEMLLVV